MAAGATYTPIATTTLGSGQTSVTFSSIASTYSDLIVVMNYSQSGSEYPSLQFNGDTGTNYSWLDVGGNGTSAVSYSGNTVASIPFLGYVVSGSNWGNVIAHINNYANTNMWKTIVSYDGNPPNFLAATSGSTELMINTWRSTAAISSIQIGTNNGATYAAGSMFTLYGIKGA